MTQFDEDDRAIAGTYAISVVSIGSWSTDGEPMPSVQSAVCDYCGGWASELWTAGRSMDRGGDPLFNAKVSRTERVTVYACPTHSIQVGDQLADEFGGASNAYQADELALEIMRDWRSRNPVT